MFAAKNSNLKVTRTILAAGAKMDDRDSKGGTPLMSAAHDNPNPDVIKILLEAGADVKERDGSGGTPLMSAAYNNGNPDIIKALHRGRGRRERPGQRRDDPPDVGRET